MTGFERRWRDAVLVGILPDLEGVDTRAFWPAFEAAAPPLLRLGLRGGVWVLTLSPVLLIGRPALFHRLSPEDRDRVVVAAAAHRWYGFRQVASVLKLIACFAYFRDPAGRGRFT